MKKVIAICAIAFASCTGNETKVETTPTTTDSAVVTVDSTMTVDSTKTVAVDTTKVN